jgi:uncharacterized BrkB/YihY/UPF0761 family membrane protein
LLAGSAARWSSHNAPRLGAALAFYTLLSITPLLIVVTAIASLVYGSAAARDEIVDQVSAVAGSAGASVVGAILGRAENTHSRHRTSTPPLTSPPTWRRENSACLPSTLDPIAR